MIFLDSKIWGDEVFVVNDDMSIYATRGDTGLLAVSANNNGVNYVFQPGEVVRLRVFEKKGCHCVVLQKDVAITEAVESVDMVLTEKDTKIGEIISKPKDYWYEIELNPFTEPQTIVGYDDDGPKVFRLFPEGANVDDITPEDIPIVDAELDMTSERPIQNQAVAREMLAMQTDIDGAGAIAQNAKGAAEKAQETANRAGQEATAVKNRMQNDVVPRLAEVESDIEFMKTYVTPQMFGAKGDGVQDDTPYIQAAMDASLNVYIPGGTYLVDGKYTGFTDSPNGGIKLRSGQRVYMAYDCIIQVQTNEGAFYEAFNVYNCYNVEIHGGHIVGERQTHDPNTHSDLPNRTQGFGIAVQNSDNVLIDNVDISEMWGDAIVLHTPDNVTGYNSNITIRNCNLHDCERQGISVVVGDNVLISNCTIGAISGHAPQSGIDIEPHSQAGEDMYVHDVTIENCKFIDNVQSLCYSRCYNVTANNCSFGENVIAVQLATNVKFNNCDIFSAWMQNDSEPSFYGCRIGRVLNESTGITRFYDCYFTGAVPEGATHSYILTGNKGGTAHFKNCEFMLKCDGTDKSYCRIVNGASKARFDGCSFATVDNETVRLFANLGEYEFYGCTINLTTSYEYPFLNPAKLIMQNCNVKVPKMVCLYNADVDSGYVFMSGNVFDAGSYICRINDGTTFATTPSIALLNNIRNDVSRDFVRVIDGVTATDINNNII